MSTRDAGTSLHAASTSSKTQWGGTVTAVQPRIRLTRSFDQRSHSYQGYVLRVSGSIAGETREFLVAVGPAAHAKHQLRAGDTVSGEGIPVAEPRLETADIYRVSKLQVAARGPSRPAGQPPWQGIPPELPDYRERGHRRLSSRTYEKECARCIWGCKMAVEMIIDHWNPSRRRYRTETFCYGPLSCPAYRAGPTRSVPGRSGMTYEEEEWVDDEATSHRAPDE
jgi:hypothetical protein